MTYILPNGEILRIVSETGATIGWAFAESTSTGQEQHWMLYPGVTRPPTPNASFTLTSDATNKSLTDFVAVVNTNWSTGAQYIESACTEYDTYELIPATAKPKFQPTVVTQTPSGRGGGGLPVSGDDHGTMFQTDMGTLAIFDLQGGGGDVGFVNTEDDGSDPDVSHEYWTLATAYDPAHKNKLAAGAISNPDPAQFGGTFFVTTSTKSDQAPS